ncbi:MAG: phosphatidate cytidylyltransferase [Micromonosporaceae bacterium]
MPALHTPSSGGGWFDPQQSGPEYRARPTDVAPESSWDYPSQVGNPTAGPLPTGYGPPPTGYGPRHGDVPDHPEPWNEPRTEPQGYRAPQHYDPSQGDPRGYQAPTPPVGQPGQYPRQDPYQQQDPYRHQQEAYQQQEAYPPVDPSPEPSRAGRNLPMAIMVGVTLGALVIGSLFFWRPAFVVLATAAILLGIWEMVRAVEPVEARPPLPPLLIGGAAIMVLAWFAGIEAMVLGLVLTVVSVLVWRLSDGPVGYQRDFTAATLIAAYVPFLAGFAVLLVQPEDGALRVTIMIATVVLSDVGGYATGVSLGRHPMAPTVSPKKSWEGFAGSLTASAAGGAVMLVLMFGQPWWQGAIFGVAIAFAATLGDLSESLMKRDLGIKDMGQLLPGHGGLMDRLDSLLLAAPVAYLLLVLFAPPTG